MWGTGKWLQNGIRRSFESLKWRWHSKQKDCWKESEKQIFPLVQPPVTCGWILLLDFIILSRKIRKMNSETSRVLKFYDSHFQESHRAEASTLPYFSGKSAGSWFYPKQTHPSAWSSANWTHMETNNPPLQYGITGGEWEISNIRSLVGMNLTELLSFWWLIVHEQEHGLLFPEGEERWEGKEVRGHFDLWYRTRDGNEGGGVCWEVCRACVSRSGD